MVVLQPEVNRMFESSDDDSHPCKDCKKTWVESDLKSFFDMGACAALWYCNGRRDDSTPHFAKRKGCQGMSGIAVRNGRVLMMGGGRNFSDREESRGTARIGGIFDFVLSCVIERMS